jgi:hypothetical protein
MRCVALAVVAAVVIAPGAASAAPRAQTLFFDALYAKAGTSGPGDDMVGHVQFGSGKLRDAGGHTVGSFAFTCRWIAILADGDARERCTGHGTTSDGRIEVAGPALRNAAAHTWSVTRGTGAYRSAHGSVVVRDLGTTETLVSFAIRPRRGATLRAGLVPDPAANAGFRKRASAQCRKASATLAARPPFPYQDFDPQHPDPAELKGVGQYFTGPGDPRPALDTLKEELTALGRPPALRPRWASLLKSQADQLVTIERQDNAALAGDAATFVATLDDSDANFRAEAIAATLFGVTDCIV